MGATRERVNIAVDAGWGKEWSVNGVREGENLYS